MADTLAGLIDINALYTADSYDETVTESAAVDIKGIEGNLVVLLDVEKGTGATPTLDLAIQHRADSADTWGAVPAAALYDPATGEAGTFTQVTGAADSTQVLALKRELLKAEVRGVLTIGGTGPDFVAAAYLIGLPKYSSGW